MNRIPILLSALYLMTPLIAQMGPTETTPDMLCNSCQAITREVLKLVKNSRSEYEVY